MATTFDIDFGGKKKCILSPQTVIFYDEEFSNENRDADIIEDFIKLSNTMERTGALSAIKVMQIIWACEKTYRQGTMETFSAWVKMLPNAPLDNTDIYEKLAGAMQSEFFRGTEIETDKEK